MKEIIFIFIFFMSLSSVFAISTNLHNKYAQGETIITRISGVVLDPITKDNVEFRRGHVLVPLEYDVQEIDGSYYLWAISPSNSGNYTLILKDVTSMVNGIQKKMDFAQNFSVSENLTLYNINPGFIKTRDSFSIELNSYVDDTLSVQTNYPDNSVLEVKPGKNVFNFPLTPENIGFINMSIGIYTLPLYIIVPSENMGKKLEFAPEVLRDVIFANRTHNKTYSIKLVNKYNISIRNIELEYDLNILNIYPSRNISIGPNGDTFLNVSLIGAVRNNIDLSVYAKSGEYSASLPIHIKWYANESQINSNGSQVLFYCEELGGSICASGTGCDIGTVASMQGACCLGTCKAVKKDSGSLGWIGYLIVIIVLIIIGFLFWKYKKTPSNTSDSALISESVKPAENLP